jgi:phage protein D
VEKIAIAEVRTAEEAKEKAIGVLKTIAGELVKATGTAIGMPELRTGRIVQITRLGPRFSGLYRLSQTTHTLGPAGYTVAFQARKLVLK